MLDNRSLTYLFGSNCRPDKKLIWRSGVGGTGGIFDVADADTVAYMTHPTTGEEFSVLEPSATNEVIQSNDFSAWGGTANFDIETVTGVIKNPSTGSLLPGYKLTNIHASSSSIAITRTAGVLTAGANCAYGIFRKDTSGVTGMGIRDAQENNWVVLGRMYWDRTEDHFEVVTSQAGTQFKSNCIFLEDDLVLVWIVFTALNPGNTRIFYFYPGMSGPGTSTILYHAQLEETAWFTSPIVTSTTPAVRLGDSFLSEAPYELGDDSTGTIIISFAYPMGFSPDLGFSFYEEYTSSVNRLLIYGVPNSANGVRLYMRSSEAGRQNRIIEITAPRTTEIQTIKISVDKEADKIAMVFNGEYKETVNANCWQELLTNSRIGFSSYGNVWLHQVYRDKIPRFDQTLVDFIPPENPQ